MPVIREWFRGQTVLITGGTGFLGLGLIYKLLTIECPKIYVLIRPKKGQNVEQRLDAMVKSYAFDSLRDKVDIRSKLVAIPFDSLAPGLAISDEHRAILQNEVTVVLHGAASVKFDDTIKVATIINLRMTREIMELAKTMKKVQVVTYVSTAFANCEHMMNGVEEKLYETKMDWRTMIKAAETIPEELLNSLEQKLLGASPNTYTFTKHLAESLANDYRRELPVVIIRPEIILSAIAEPEPGWMNNLSSPVAIMGGSGKGVLRLYFGVPNTNKAYVPIDVVVNGTLVATWKKATQPSKELLPIYNTTYMPVKAEFLKQCCYKVVTEVPMKDALWHRHFHFVTNRHAFLVFHLLVHVLPALVIDGLLKVTGNKTRLVRVYRKMYMAYVYLAPFLNISDLFYTRHFEELMKGIPSDEKDTFYADMEFPKNFEAYMKYAAIGFRVLLGDPREISQEDYSRSRRLYYLDLMLKYSFYLTIVWFIPYTSIMNCITTTLYEFISLFDLSDLEEQQPIL